MRIIIINELTDTICALTIDAQCISMPLYND